MKKNKEEKKEQEERAKEKMQTEKPSESIQKKKVIAIKPWVLLVVFNVLMVGASLFLISSLQKMAIQLNQRLSDEQKIKESKRVDITGLEYQPTKESVDKLMSYFPEEPGVIDFIELMEAMQDQGTIKNFSLVGQDAVKDKTGAYGIPFIVEFEGSWENINSSLQEFQKIPYLVRVINIEANVIDANIVNFKYGGFLYVSDELAKTR